MEKPFSLFMVKNEAPIIARAMRSVKDLVCGFVVLDTGSTDDTPRVMLETATELSLPIYFRRATWKNFADGRNKSLEFGCEIARRKGRSFLLMFDADEVIEGGLPDLTPYSDIDIFDCDGVLPSGDTYLRVCLFNVRCKLRYQGVTHEALINKGDIEEETFKRGRMETIKIREINDSHRRVTGQKGPEDLKLLEEAYKADPTNTRGIFYLARSYMFEGRCEEAVPLLRKYLELEKEFHEEIFYVKLHLGHCLIELKQSPVEIWFEAFSERSWRNEPLVYLARWCAGQNMLPIAKIFYERALGQERPKGESRPIMSDCYGDALTAEYEILTEKMKEEG